MLVEQAERALAESRKLLEQREMQLKQQEQFVEQRATITHKILGNHRRQSKQVGWRCGCISSTDHEGGQFGLLLPSAKTAGASLCRRMKS
jgi:hypothetical protein